MSEQSFEQREDIRIGKLAPFDMGYFHQLEGEDGWIALGKNEYENQQYFTVVDEKGRKLGIVGIYDFGDQKNITHTVVDPEFRGRGLAADFKMRLADQLGLDSFHSTIDPENTASMHAIEKVPGIRQVNLEKEKHDGDKAIFEWRREWMDDTTT